MTQIRFLAALAACALVLGLVPDGHATLSTWTCETVANRNAPDPAGGEFSSSFDDPGVNDAGDVVFHAKTKRGGNRRVFLGPNGGPIEAVVSRDDPAPGGSEFGRFGSTSINNAGTIGFFASLRIGEGVFFKESGSPVAAAALQGGASPAGGTFDRFRVVSRINVLGDLAFVATVSGGPSGVFLYEGGPATVSTVALEEMATGDGREFCSFKQAVGLGDDQSVALHAVTETDCGVSGDPLDAMYVASGGFTLLAQEDDPTPVAGTTYNKLLGTPDVNGSGNVLLRARTKGDANVKALILVDPGVSASVVAIERDTAAPEVGGEMRSIAPAQLADTDEVLFRARVRGGSAKDGLFLLPGEAVIAAGDPAPTDAFGLASQIRRIDTESAVARSAGYATFTGRVRDTNRPRSTSGLFRCDRL